MIASVPSHDFGALRRFACGFDPAAFDMDVLDSAVASIHPSQPARNESSPLPLRHPPILAD